MSKVFLFLFFAFIAVQTTQARKPAVDPIVGISIEEYKQVPPSKARGFDFSTSKQVSKRVYNVNKLSTESVSDTGGSENILIIFLVFLPIIASGMTFHLMKKNVQQENNVYDLFGDRTSTTSSSDDNDDHHDDSDIPKAS